MDDQIRLLARTLVDDGLQHAFGVTGSGSSLLLITELEALGARYFPVFHEASAALMAGAVSRMTNNVSVSISIKGPGLANMLPGIVSNYFEGNPSLSISEAYGEGAPSSRMHKRLDHGALLSAVTKGVLSLKELDQLPGLLDKARSEVPGPVHLELCERDEAEGLHGSLSPAEEGHPQTSAQILDQAIKYIHGCQRPALIVGSLAARRGWRDQLSSLSIPVFSTVAAKGVLDEGLPHSAGVFTGDGNELALETELLEEADLIIGIGLRNTEILSPNPFSSPTILLDEIAGLAEGITSKVSLTDGRPSTVEESLDELKGKSWGLEKISLLKRGLREALLDGSWLPAPCFEVLNNLDYEYSFTLDTGSFCTIGEHLWDASSLRPFLAASNGRYMGTAIPLALGMAICQEHKPTFCVTGDGGMGMYSSEIKVAIQQELPICFILMSDGLYGSVACAPTSPARSRAAVTVPEPSWWQAIERMKCESHQVESRDAFECVVRSWSRDAPLFIEAVFDPIPYSEMTRRLR
jgi:acetolactate synthase-1/2/3 large subunit